MKWLALLILSIALFSCETPKSTSASSAAVTFGGGNGSSFATAIVVHASSEKPGVDSEYRYLAKHYGDYFVSRQELEEHGGRMYDILTFGANGKKQILYFDITEFYGKS